MTKGVPFGFIVVVALTALGAGMPAAHPAGGYPGGGEALMSTDKPCYAPGEDVAITATGSAYVIATGYFPIRFWGITNASGDAVFQPLNGQAAIGWLDGTLEGTWDQTYLLDTWERRDPRTGTPVPSGTYTIWFYEVVPEEWRPPGWIPTDIEIGDCAGGALVVTLRVMPRTLNVRSQGWWVTARIDFDDPVAGDVDPQSLTLEGVLAGRVGAGNETTAMAKFPRGDLIAVLPVGSSVEVCVAGALMDGRLFGACDAIRVDDPGR